ncbi:3-methyladenine DNA glycosylase [Actinokineospora spheciospongiae]|uniref:3-methyladenine DNA glycosylase n=1 Tax=Actinokineospora spheciospongiae TaxID=909613 RepID=UPI000D714581|nr:3-methyladenine DNA glycosylase [Actinokineospora spheciospongiae]
MPEVLAEADWLEHRAAHERRVRRWTEPHVRRRALGEKHPVLDFLFTYYSHRPAHLERWHPGVGVALAGPRAEEYLRWKAYRRTPQGVAVSTELPESRVRTAEFVRGLLRATASRPPRLACFGLHEWAMVYRQPEEQVRHVGWPLRLGPQGTDAVVESQKVVCGHYDAFRFFTEPARPLNTLSPSREGQLAMEQPGCLHATMDLFKWAYKLDPYTPSELVADCFELALEVRALDMRASPYDLSELGYSPVRIETAEGRKDYAALQAGFARRAAPLRTRLIEVCDRLLG